jgi:hypothetical protein
MTESICGTARELALQELEMNIQVEVYYDMDDQLAHSNRGDELMREWLGYDFLYQLQEKGSLTNRLLAVFQNKLPCKTIIVGMSYPSNVLTY